MRYIFIIQGEGRGHLTQAMTLERLLTGRGHQVVKMMVGRSPQRTLPDFFLKGVSSPLEQFESMNFVPSSSHKRADMTRTIAYNALCLYRFLPSIRRIRDVIRDSNADVVVNFYEIMAGMAYTFFRIKTPMVSIGHQYVFQHEGYEIPHEMASDGAALNLFSKLTSRGSVKRLALSFRSMPQDKAHAIVAVPPLLRPEVMDMKAEKGKYVHGYMLNYGFADDVLAWHKEHPEVELRFFWDRKDAETVTKVDDTLFFHVLDDREFLRQMGGCMAYASTAGFESVCEAMYLGKPVLMVPSHVEQKMNAFDAVNAGAGISCDRFDLSGLIEFAEDFVPDTAFKEWVDSASDIIVRELENIH